ncbi:tyrosine-type recombinase/integrase [Sphingomonas pituitosa]|uniref:tyrosine-type recombinase/integrase n=1 Tax=Sphingomonas pituitosa TaxID=99597 RepID=UPI0009FC9FC4|nr:tyrosine-type recombinase/integrase [Sphingomonas pituitosa]
MQHTIYDANGQRKYLTNSERTAFLKAAEHFDLKTLTLCWLISSTGCRISEALSLTSASIDVHAKLVIIECLKKRRRGVFRAVPVPSELINLLIDAHNLRSHLAQGAEALRLWTFSRVTAYRRIRKVMEAAGLSGSHAMPKGLRHCFGVTAIQSQVPLNLVQRWLGHADMRTTAIYAGASGPEERSIARRMWRVNAMTLPELSRAR